MTIQSAVNQILSQAQIGAGFYAHSPAGQTAAQVRQKKNVLAKLQGKEESGLSSTTDVEKAAAIANEIFELQPTSKNLDVAEITSGQLQKQNVALQRAETRANLLNAQKEIMESGWAAIRDKYKGGSGNG